MNDANMRPDCACLAENHSPRLVVLTGGPGAGKTAVLEIIRRHFCDHIAVLPEAASIVFGGGFPRLGSLPGRRASQAAIFAVQRQLERLAIEERRAAVVLCDRGSLDGLAYWPLDDASFFAEMETTRERELARYAAVIHLRTPTAAQGYDHRNPVRIESALEAAAADAKIAEAWRDHPRRTFVESTGEFLEKAARAVALVRDEVPECCRAHPVPFLPNAGVEGACKPERHA
jgi:predicted ATPase